MLASAYPAFQKVSDNTNSEARTISKADKDEAIKLLEDRSKTWFNVNSENRVSELQLPPAIKKLDIEYGGLVSSWQRGSELGTRDQAFHITKDGTVVLKGASSEHVIKVVGFSDSTEMKYPKAAEPSFRRTVLDEKDLTVYVSGPEVDNGKPGLSDNRIGFSQKALAIGIPSHPDLRFKQVVVTAQNGKETTFEPNANRGSAFRASFDINGTSVQYRNGAITIDGRFDVPKQVKFVYELPGSQLKGSRLVEFKPKQ